MFENVNLNLEKILEITTNDRDIDVLDKNNDYEFSLYRCEIRNIPHELYLDEKNKDDIKFSTRILLTSNKLKTQEICIKLSDGTKVSKWLKEVMRIERLYTYHINVGLVVESTNLKKLIDGFQANDKEFYESLLFTIEIQNPVHRSNEDPKKNLSNYKKDILEHHTSNSVINFPIKYEISFKYKNMSYLITN